MLNASLLIVPLKHSRSHHKGAVELSATELAPVVQRLLRYSRTNEFELAHKP